MSKELKKKELLFSWIDKLDKKLSPSMKTKRNVVKTRTTLLAMPEMNVHKAIAERMKEKRDAARTDRQKLIRKWKSLD